jgi:hypothetical protein
LLTPLWRLGLVALLSLLCGCADQNHIQIINRTTNDVFVTAARRNGKALSKKVILLPTSKNGESYIPAQAYARFRGNTLGHFELDIREPSGEPRTANCQLRFRTPGGCLFTVSYYGPQQLTCLCDPLSDLTS